MINTESTETIGGMIIEKNENVSVPNLKVLSSCGTITVPSSL